MFTLEQWSSMGEPIGVSRPYLHPFTEGVEIDRIHSLVIMRLPWNLTEDLGRPFLQSIVAHGLLPLVFSGDSHAVDAENQPWYYWPTDEFRQIGDYIVPNGLTQYHQVFGHLRESNAFGYKTAHVLRSMVNRFFIQEAYFCGGDYQAEETTQTLFYAKNSMPLFLTYEQSGSPFDYEPITNILQKDGWSFVSLDTSGISLPTHKGREDLDFVFFPFAGNDGQLHCVVAEVFARHVPDGIIKHIISDEEALRGGCNVADCARGSVLLSPNRRDASTCDILEKNSLAAIIEVPSNYLEGGGGPRCLTSSITFE